MPYETCNGARVVADATQAIAEHEPNGCVVGYSAICRLLPRLRPPVRHGTVLKR